MNRVCLTLIAVLGACRGRDAAPAAAPIPASPTDAGAVATAIDAETAAGSPRDPHEYRSALRRGRELAHRHDWRGAIAAFEAALAAAPGDARALSELGWAALHAGDLDRAAQASQQAADAPGATARLRAASLYNLGRAEEAEGDRAAAETAYRASLALRTSRAVRRHLRAIGAALVPGRTPARPPEPDPDTDPTTAEHEGVAGPFATIDAYCDARDGDGDDDAASVVCLPQSGLGAGVDHVAGPPEVRIAAMRGELDDVTCLIAVHAQGGWYVWDGVPCETTTAAGTDWAASLGLDAPAPGRLVARFAIGVAARSADGAGRGHHACQELVVACRVDRARPACTPAVPVAWAARCADAATTDLRWDAQADWSFDGDALIVRAPAGDHAAPDGLTELASERAPLR